MARNKTRSISTRATRELRALILSVARHYTTPGMPNPSASAILECLLREGVDSLRAKGVAIAEVPLSLTDPGVDFTLAISAMLGQVAMPHDPNKSATTT